jgi:hypothetical protein
VIRQVARDFGHLSPRHAERRVDPDGGEIGAGFASPPDE